MKELLKINKQKLDNHMYYGKWYYIAAIIAAIVLVNLAYTLSAPEYPKENTVSIMMYTGIGQATVVEEWETEMLSMVADDQREVNLITTTPVDISTQSVVVARITATQDDILVLSLEDVESYAKEGAFLPLEKYVDLESIFAMYPDVNWDEYKLISNEDEAKEEHFYYLPLYMVEGYDKLGTMREDFGIAILANSVNAENSAICFEYLMTQK